MAAKKKASAPKKASKKKPAKKASGKKAAKKSPAKKKAAAARKASARKKSASTAKATPSEPAAETSEPIAQDTQQASGSASEAPTTSAPGQPPHESPPRPAGSVSSMDVTLGHVFALRPRVNTSFRKNDLSQARHALAQEVYPGIAEAARAVAEEALALTRGAAARPEKRRRR